jgi:hypothetical protein
MQVRLAGVAAVADQSQHLPARDFIAYLDSYRAELKMGVHCEDAASQVEIDVVAGDSFQRDPASGGTIGL